MGIWFSSQLAMCSLEALSVALLNPKSSSRSAKSKALTRSRKRTKQQSDLEIARSINVRRV
eukprot:2220205-Karenia_brevis.AAC.1